MRGFLSRVLAGPQLGSFKADPLSSFVFVSERLRDLVLYIIFAIQHNIKGLLMWMVHNCLSYPVLRYLLIIHIHVSFIKHDFTNPVFVKFFHVFCNRPVALSVQVGSSPALGSRRKNTGVNESKFTLSEVPAPGRACDRFEAQTRTDHDPSRPRAGRIMMMIIPQTDTADRSRRPARAPGEV